MIALREEIGACRVQCSPRTVALPQISRSLLTWFTWYARGYLRRHFHALRVSRSTPAPESEAPIVLFCNHASWWDPLLCLVLKSDFFPKRDAYAPIDATMLEKYRFFKGLGFFGVEPETARGAAAFLRMGEAILQAPSGLLAVTPQGRFADVRERPVRFKAGLGHLAARAERALFVPVAIEYTFWDERLPEALIRFGEPLATEGESRASDEWTKLFEQSLERTQEALAIEAQARDARAFETVLRGGAGQGGVYDLWRSARARLRGERFNQEHSAI